MISLDTGYLKDLANNIILTERHSLDAIDILLLIDHILNTRGASLENHKSNTTSTSMGTPYGVVGDSIPQP